MSIPIPSGLVPIKEVTADDALYGERRTSYRWEVLEHADGSDHLVGELDGVIEPGASLNWTNSSAVKGGGSLKVTDLAVARDGMLRIADVELESLRLRPVLVIEGLPEIPLGVFLVSSAPEEWTSTGRVYNVSLLDRATVLDQDEVDASYTVDTVTPILSAVAAVIASAGESITVDAEVTTTLASAKVWPTGTSKLQIVNDLLAALNYGSLWVDGIGNYRATPYVVPAQRSVTYELLNRPRALVDGEQSIYLPEWTRDKDIFGIPNKIITIQAASGDAAPRRGVATNTDPDSPFSYSRRGRWISVTLDGIEVPSGTDVEIDAFLDAVALRSLIARSAVQQSIQVKHLPVPLRVSEAMRFANVPAGIDARHTATSISLEAHPLGLMSTTLQEVIDL